VLESYGITIWIFFLASISDFLDGYLARKYNLESELGRILDPIADKILIAFTLIALTVHLDSFFIGLMTSLILAREFWVSALRELNAIQNHSHATKVTLLAKIKTTTQFLAIAGYIFALYLNLSILLFASNLILFSAVLITLITGLEYTLNTFKAHPYKE
jgi:CDP-diacylglycerol--glycerol-3-phosphate 3-phosphatidyltransferase